MKYIQTSGLIQSMDNSTRVPNGSQWKFKKRIWILTEMKINSREREKNPNF